MPVSIEFSQHSLLKIKILKFHGLEISREMIEDIIRNPDKVEYGYKERLIAQKLMDKEHVMRVVYEKYPDRILVITFYPGRRSRYEKD